MTRFDSAVVAMPPGPYLPVALVSPFPPSPSNDLPNSRSPVVSHRDAADSQGGLRIRRASWTGVALADSIFRIFAIASGLVSVLGAFFRVLYPPSLAEWCMMDDGIVEIGWGPRVPFVKYLPYTLDSSAISGISVLGSLRDNTYLVSDSRGLQRV